MAARALQNTLLDDYVSEKFFTPLKMGTTLLVVFGAPNIEDWAPAPHSIINALEWRGPAELAAYLNYLDANTTAYLEYFRWMDADAPLFQPSFVALEAGNYVNEQRDSFVCRLCTHYRERYC